MTARQTTYQPPKEGIVLLAEDDALTGKAIKADLEKKNFKVEWSSTFDAAVEQFKQKDFHAVIADVYLQSEKPNGLDLVKLAREAGIPSVIITSALDMEVAKEGLNSGADHLIEKPFKVEELTEALNKIWENPRGLIARRERCLDQHSLTEKEKELCRLVLKGLTNQEISEVSGTTVGTVKFYSSQIFEKFQVKNRAELFNFVFPT